MRVSLKRTFFAHISLFINILFLSSSSYAATGIEWLSSIQSVDGSYITSTDVATASQSTAETLSTFHMLQEQLQSGIPAALDFVNSEPYLNTENLARQIITNFERGHDVTGLIDKLVMHQNDDSGFGELPRYHSTAIDTAYALQAMAVAGYDDTNILSYTVAYLTSQQNSDGSFALSDRNQSSTYITAVSSLALQKYIFQFDVSNEIKAANEFLLSQQSVIGGWGSEWESAISLLSIVTATTDATRYADSVQWLRDKQLGNGSWSDDAFTTSLALRALRLTENVQAPADPTVGVLIGRAVHGETGQFLSDVTITIDQQNGTSILSESDGRFIFSELASASYLLSFQAEGFASVTQDVVIVAGQVTDLGSVKITPLPEVGLVTGVVTDASSGLPIADAAIQISGASTTMTTTNSNGYYRLVSGPGSITVNCSATGYGSETAIGSVLAGGAFVYSPSLRLTTGVVDPVSGQDVSIKGIVVDGDTGVPIENALIKVVGTQLNTFSTATGKFDLTGITPGEFLVEVSSGTYKSVNFTSLSTEGSRLDIGIVRLYPVQTKIASTISGVVKEANTDVVISGAWVSVNGQNIDAITNESGQYSIEGVIGNQFSLSVRATGYLGAETNISVARPTNVILDVALERAVAADFDIIDVHIESGVTSYPANSELEIDAVLFNSGVNDRSTRIFYKILDDGNRIVEEGTVLTVAAGAEPVTGLLTVPAAQTVEVSIEWNTNRNVPGIYQVIAQAYDADTGKLLAERGMQITIESTVRIGGQAEFDPPIAQLAGNRPIHITATVSNQGNQISDATTVTARLTMKAQGYQAPQADIYSENFVIDNGLSNSQSMDMDSSGNIYVANTDANTVSVITPYGVVTEFATGFDRPIDIDIDANNDIYILNTSNSFVRIASDGVRTNFNTGLSDQQAIESLTNGRILIAQIDGLYEVSQTGDVNLIVSDGLSNPQGMATDSQGTIYIANRDENSITQFKDGALSTFIENINRPYGITVDATDHLIVTSYGDNSLLNIAPDKTVSVITTGLSGPYDVKIDASGDYLVTNYISSEVVRVAGDGNISLIAGQSVNNPYALTYDSANNLYIGNTKSGTITKYSSEGVITQFATNVSSPIAMLDDGSGGLVVLENGLTLTHVNSDGTKTVIASGLSGGADLIKALDGNGYLISETNKNEITRIGASGQLSTYLSSALKSVRNIRSAPDGNIYLINASGSLIKINADASTETIATGIENPFGLAVDAEGNFYTSELNTKQVLKITAIGSVSVLAKTSFTPGALTVTTTGEVLVSQYMTNKLFIIDSTGVANSYATLGATVYSDILADAEGNIWVPDNSSNRLLKRDANGIETVYPMSFPAGVESDGAGGVYTASQQSVKHVTSAGLVTTLFSDNHWSSAQGGRLALDANGRMWVASGNSAMYRYASDFSYDKHYNALGRVQGMAYDGNGALIVTSKDGKVMKLKQASSLPEVIALGNYSDVEKEPGNSLLLAAASDIRRFDPATDSSVSIGNRYSNLVSLAVSQDGRYAAADISRNEVLLFAANDTELNRFAGLSNPKGIAIDGSGRIFIANSNPSNISLVGSGGNISTHAYTPNVEYLYVDSSNHLIASSGKSLIEHDEIGNVISNFANYSSELTGITADIDGNVLTGSLNGTLLQRKNDNTYKIIASGLGLAKDVEIDSAGNVLIADSTRGVIHQLNVDNSTTVKFTNIPGAKSIDFDSKGGIIVLYSSNQVSIIDASGARQNLPISQITLQELEHILMVDDRSFVTLMPSKNTMLKITFDPLYPDINPGDVVFTTTVPLEGLAINDKLVALDFGSWKPAVSGDYLLEVFSDNAAVGGTFTNTLHVGASASAAINLPESVLPPGNVSMNAQFIVSGADSTSVTRFDTDNAFLVTESGVLGARGIIADTQGNVYVSDAYKIRRIGPDSVVTDINFDRTLGHQLAVDSNDNIYGSVEPNKVFKLTPKGEINILVKHDSIIWGVAVDYQDRIFIVDESGTLSQVFQDGSLKTISTAGMPNPFGLTIDGFGNFYVSNFSYNNTNSEITKIDPDGISATLFDKAWLEREGINITSDCSNNLLFAPMKIFPSFSAKEETTVFQMVGNTGEVRTVFYGPSVDPALADMDSIQYDRFSNRVLIWSDLSNGKIFSFPVICGGIDAEAHLITRADVDLSSSDPAPISMIDLPDGNKEYVWSLKDVNNEGKSIQLNMLFKGLNEGETRSVFKDAYMQFNNAFDPNEPVRVPIDIPNIMVSSQLAVNTVIDATQYLPESLVNITSKITNDSTTTFNGTLKASIFDAQGVLVESLTDVSINNLASQHAVTFSNVWNTGNKLIGDYTVLATLIDTTGVAIASSEQTFRITAGIEGVAFITSSVTSNKPLYSAWDQVVINGRVRNTSSNVIQGTSFATVTVTNPEGAVVHTETLSLKTLTPGSYDNVAIFIELVDVMGGPYNVVMVTHDAASGAELTRSANSFTVERIVNQGIVGNISTAFPQIEMGAANTCIETVTNISASAVSNLTVQHLFVNATTSEVLSTQSQTLSLSAKESKSFDQAVTLSNGQPGLYACVLQVETSGVVKTLATAGFEYTENPIDIGIDLHTATAGRVLVLLDSQTQYDDYGNAYQSDLDPHGPDDASLLSVQRSYITQLLDSMGWSYTIVEDADSFTHELRSSGYSSYALFSEQIKLPNQVQEELREAVYRGEGLLVAGSHDMRNNKLVDALGIKVYGKDTSAEGFILPPSSVHSGGSSSFIFNDIPLRISSLGAVAIGSYTGIDNTAFNEASNIAVTQYAYGEGVSIFVGFDLLAQAAKATTASNTLFAELLVSALAGIDATGDNLKNGDVIPVSLSLTNLGSATPGMAAIKLPLDSLILDSRPGVPVIDNVINWIFDLAEDEAEELIFWLRLPLSGGSRSLDAQVFSGIEPNLEYFDSQQIPVTITPTATLAGIVIQIADLSNDSKDYKQAYRLISNAQDAALVNDYRTALTAVVNASSELASIHTLAAQGVRLKLANIIRQIALQQ